MLSTLVTTGFKNLHPFDEYLFTQISMEVTGRLFLQDKAVMGPKRKEKINQKKKNSKKGLTLY